MSIQVQTATACAEPQTSSSMLAGAILYRICSFNVLLGALLVAATFAVARLNLPDSDTWWNAEVGRQILATGRWPSADAYSFTAYGNAWMAYEWLGEAIMAAAAALGNLSGMAALLLALSAAFMVLLYYYSYLAAGNAVTALIACSVLLPLAALLFRLRPQLLGYIFLLATLIALERFRRGDLKSLWLLPLIFLLWVNTHGTFMLGLLAAGVYWMAGLLSPNWRGLESFRWTALQRRRLALTALLTSLCLAITPYGTRLVTYPFELALFQPVNIRSINEWQPMPFDLVAGKIFLAFVTLHFAAVVAARPAWRLDQTAMLLFAIYAASVHRRFVLLFVVAFAPWLSALLARCMSGHPAAKPRYALNAALLLLVIAGLIAGFPSRQQLESSIAREYPQQAIEHLSRNPVPGALFNEYDWGGYLIWSRGPGAGVFIDGRGDIYEYSGVLADYMHVARLGPGALPLLRKYGISACLLRRQSPLATLLASQQQDWQQTYSDSLSSIFVRRQSGF